MSIDTKLEGLPRINWPERTGFYKVVQLNIGGQPYSRFEEAEAEGIVVTYADIVKSLAERIGRECQKIRVGDFHEIPALKSEWYEVSGMEQAALDTQRRVVSFFGESGEYNIGINYEHLELMKPLAHNWKIKAE